MLTHSVMPYAVMRSTMPRSLRIRSTRAGGTLAAPVVPPRSDEQSHGRLSSSARSIWKIVGGPGMKVMRSRSIRSMACATSNCGIGTATAPESMQATQPTFIPKEWKNGLAIR